MTILITGGTGLVGQRLSQLLTEQGHQVIHLSRKENLKATYPAYQWNLKKGTIDLKAIEQADYVVHLAGANVAGQRWSTSYKKTIIDSRVKSAELLQKAIQQVDNKPKGVIAASAVGYYGDRGKELLTEESSKGKGFLSDVVKVWEEANQKFENVVDRVVQLRIGIVLSTQGGALAKMLPSYMVRTGAYFGNGSQYYPWIHIDDLCQMFMVAIKEEAMQGTYNAVAPNPVTNKTLAYKIAEALDKPSVILPTPAFTLKFAMGEMASIVLDGANVSARKILDAGFQFEFTDVVEALRDLVKQKI